jgi:hypothetical protein
VTEDLRALLRADLNAERPPPLGDVVGAAIRAGRRTRRNRRIGAFGTAVVLLAVGAVLVGDGGVAARTDRAAGPPPTVPIVPPAAPIDASQARTLTIHSGTVRVDGLRTKATSATMLHLLTLLLPPGRTSHYGVAPDDDLRVQLYLDDGDGPAMVRVGLEKIPPYGDESPRDGTVTVTIQHMPDKCASGTMVDARWPDGTVVQVEAASCRPPDAGAEEPAAKERRAEKPSSGRAAVAVRPALTTEQAIRVATDPRWGLTMDEGLVSAGALRFPDVPVFGR